MTPEKMAVAICMQAHIPVFLWGEPGIGKTRSLMALANKLGEPLWTVILSIRGPWDQGGLPVIRPDGSVFMAPPSWAKELAESGHGCVFLDELNVAAPETQNSALRVVNEFQAGDQPLPEATAFMAAGNPPETNPGAYDLTAAMANRLVHIEWPIDHPGWVQGMKNGWREEEPPRIAPDWKRLIDSKRSNVANFIEARGEEALHCKPEDPSAAGRAWPSHRTWDHAAIVSAAAQSAGFDLRSNVARLLIAGCVGEAPAREFRTWFINLDLRNPEDYLRDPDGTPLPDRQDKTMATLDAVASAALSVHHPPAARLARYKAAWRVVARVGKAEADLATPAASTLCKALGDPLYESMLNNLPDDVFVFTEVLERANIDLSRK